MTPPSSGPAQPPSKREKLWRIIFEAETPKGRLFDLVLLWLIAASVLSVMLETVESIDCKWGPHLDIAEWFFTGLFTAEYLLRLWLSRKPMRYATSFFGLVDLLSCLPQYLALVFGSAQGFAVIRVLRLLRVFRVLKMINHLKGARLLLAGLRQARAKITVFFMAVLLLCTIAGTLLFFVEGAEPNTKFTSIPISIYYAVVSVTTVGYGDISVTTDIGRVLTTLMILTGFAIIGVPTGLVSGSLPDENSERNETTGACPACGIHGHLLDAVYCRRCAQTLDWTHRGQEVERE